MKLIPSRFMPALALLAALWLGAPRGLGAAPTWPSLMNYQGQLTDSSGNAVADGTYSVVFSIYNVASGGANLWTETQTVTSSKGLFNAILGTVNSLSNLAVANYGSDLWVGIKVGTDAEMTPRQQLLPSAYAKNSQMLSGLLTGTAASNIPVLDGTGHIPAGLVQGGSLAAPLDLIASSSTYNLNVSDTSAVTTAIGLKSQGSSAIYAQATDTNGYGIWAQTAAADSAAATALHGSASNGTGVVGDSVNAAGISATTQSGATPALWVSGFNGAKILSASGGGIGIQLVPKGGSSVVNVLDRPDNAGFYASMVGAANFGVSATSQATGVFGQTNSGSDTDYGVWGSNGGGGGGIGVYGTGDYGITGAGTTTGVSGTGGTYGVYGGGGSYGIYGAGPNYGVLGNGGFAGVYGIGTTVGVYANSTNYALYGFGGVYGGYGSGSTYGFYGQGGTYGIYGDGTGYGVYGTSGAVGVYGSSTSASSFGVEGVNSSGTAVLGTGGPTGVSGTGSSQGVYGYSNQYGVAGYTYGGEGVYGWGNVAADGYGGEFVGNFGVYSVGTQYGVYSVASGGPAYWGQGTSFGVQVTASSGPGVMTTGSTYGVQASGSSADYYSTGTGTYGFYLSQGSPPAGAVGVFAADSCASCFSADFINTAATTGSGAAAIIQGRLRVSGPSGSFTGNGTTTITVGNPYVTASSVLILTPKSTLTAGTTWYISSVTAGSSFTIVFSVVCSTTFNYVLIN
jgi:hypothetical protein